MDQKTFAESLVRVAQKFNTAHTDLRHLVLKTVVLALKYIRREDLWARLFGDDEYVDWDLLRQHREGGNVLGQSLLWIQLLDMFDWAHLEKNEGVILLQTPMLALLRRQIKEVQLDCGGAQGWTLACKIKILMMIAHLPTAKALDLFTCNVYKRNTAEACMQLLALQAENLYTPEEQLQTMFFILDKAVVHTKDLEHNLALSRAIKEDVKRSLELSRIQIVQGRPRLRDRLSKVAALRGNTETAFNAWESFSGFCYKHQFPPTLSEFIKTRLYFMAAQCRWDWRKHLHRVAPGVLAITQKVADYPVNEPELPVLVQIISDLSMDGRPPFGELNRFRARCFGGFPLSHVQQMTVTQFLQLYVCVFQSPKVWKELWKHFIGVLSVQIIRDCEGFVAENRFDEDSFMRVLCNLPLSASTPREKQPAPVPAAPAVQPVVLAAPAAAQPAVENASDDDSDEPVSVRNIADVIEHLTAKMQRLQHDAD